MKILSNISAQRIVFFLSQLLYQSIQLYGPNQSSSIFWLRELIDTVPYNIGTMVLGLQLAAITYGWLIFFLFKRTTLVMGLVELLGLPIAYLLLPRLTVDAIDVELVLTRILPLILLTFSGLVQIYFTVFLYRNNYLNQQVKSDAYYPVMSIARMVSLVVLRNFVSSTYLIFVLISFQAISTFYKYFYILYYDPQSELCSLVSELWGWISIMKWLFMINGLSYSILNVFIVFIFWMVYCPTHSIVHFFEIRIRRYLERAKKARGEGFYTFLMVYYIGTTVGGKRRYLEPLWSSGFRQFISIKITEREVGVGDFLQNLKATRVKSKKKDQISAIQIYPEEIGAQQVIPTPIETKSFVNLEPQPQLNTSLIQRLIKQEYLSKQDRQYSFEILYYILYLLSQVENEGLSSRYIFKVYYQILESVKNKEKEIPKIQMSIMYGLLKDGMKINEYMGNYVEEILQYDELHSVLHRYVKNEKVFHNLIKDVQIDLAAYREYLDCKIGLKDRLQKLIRVLDFMYPGCESLAMKNYIIERHINNNQISSEQRLRLDLGRINSSKTHIINFQNRFHEEDHCIFTCNFITNKGEIRHHNKIFSKMLEVKTETVKLKDILPGMWSDQHEKAVQGLNTLENFCDHSKETVYYLQSRVSRRYLQARELKIIPYFEVQSEMLLLCKMKIDNSRDLYIRKIREEKTSKLAENLTPSHKLIKSKHRIKFSNDEEPCETMDIEENEVQIFGIRYAIEAKTKFISLYTRNLIVSKMEIKLNEDVEAIIQLGTTQNKERTEIIEKSKRKLNILGALVIPFVFQMVIYSVLFGSGATSISTSFVAYIDLLSKFALLKLNYYEVATCLTPFYRITYTYNCHLNKTEGSLAAITHDLDKMQDIYNNYLQFMASLSAYKDLVQPAYKLYWSIDIEREKSYRNMHNHMSAFHFLLDSSGKLIRKGQYDHWIVQHFIGIVGMEQELLFDDNYLEYIVARETERLLKNMTAQSQVVFWLVQFFNVSAPIVAYFIFWKYKRTIEGILSKPLHMTKDQSKQFQKNYKQISLYLQKQNTASKQHTQMHLTTTMGAQSMASINERSQVRVMTEKRLGEDEDERVVVKGQFYGYFVFIVVLFGFHMLSIMVCSKKLFVAKSQFMSTLQGKLRNFQYFARFNTQVLNLYNGFLDVAAYPDTFSPQEFKDKLQKIDEIRKNINQINVTNLINNMMIQSQNSQLILFGDPCLSNPACTQKTNPYPTELNLFLTSFYKLYSEFLNPSPSPTTPLTSKFNELLHESYIQMKSLVETNFMISQMNIKAVDSILVQHEVWIALSYVGFGIFMVVMAIGVWWILMTGKGYGREVLAMLPSGALSRAKFLEFQVNSIVHKTNFAKNVIIS